MSEFKGFVEGDKKDKEVRLNISNNEVDKLIKKYKKLKKFQKSNLHEISKLSGIETVLDRLLNDYGIDSEAIE